LKTGRAKRQRLRQGGGGKAREEGKERQILGSRGGLREKSPRRNPKALRGEGCWRMHPPAQLMSGWKGGAISFQRGKGVGNECEKTGSLTKKKFPWRSARRQRRNYREEVSKRGRRPPGKDCSLTGMRGGKKRRSPSCAKGRRKGGKMGRTALLH